MNRLDPHDTIAAVASPPGPGLRGLVRVSGPEAWPIALERFTPDRPAALPNRPQLRPGRLALDGLRNPLAAAIALWPPPRTYTGQPLAEIHITGSLPLLNLVLAHCLEHGARLAEPGEFTLRAFLSGRLDLTRAEAVLAVIDAHTPAQLETALRQLAGGLGTPLRRLRDRLLDLLAHLEAGLDFVDERDVDPLAQQALAAELAQAAAGLNELADRLRTRDRPEGLPRVVLIGPPNAGKSRLFNALLGQTRAIVAPGAGTTRDYLSAPCLCDGLTVELIDTAGIEAATSSIGGQAQARRAEQAEQADLRLVCHPADGAGAGSASGPDVSNNLHVWTKADLATPPPHCGPIWSTSATTGAGLAELRLAIAAALRRQAADGNVPSATAARCRDSVIRAGASLEAAAATLASGGGDELVAIDLHAAIDELGKLIGAVVTDDLLDRIFQRFCIGK